MVQVRAAFIHGAQGVDEQQSQIANADLIVVADEDLVPQRFFLKAQLLQLKLDSGPMLIAGLTPKVAAGQPLDETIAIKRTVQPPGTEGVVDRFHFNLGYVDRHDHVIRVYAIQGGGQDVQLAGEFEIDDRNFKCRRYGHPNWLPFLTPGEWCQDETPTKHRIR